MNDAFFVRRFERRCNLDGHRQRLRLWQRPMRQSFVQRLPVDVLQHEVVGSDVVKRADVGMIQRCDGPRFSLEPVIEKLIRGFDGNVAREPGVTGFEHFTHAARANASDRHIRAEGCPRSESHR